MPVDVKAVGSPNGLPPAPRASSNAARRRMESQRRRDTAPELALRRELHRRGLRFRVDAPVPAGSRRRADIVFTARLLAVFVDGCFWHGCDVHVRPAKTSADWWALKVAANKARDRETDALLLGRGWRVLRVWEHEDPEAAADRIVAALDHAHQSPHSGRDDAT